MLKTVLKSDVLESNVCECESGFLKTTATSCLKAYKTNDILEVRLNSAFIISTCDCLFIKELNTDKLAL
jgi:hypothetical protein